MIAHPAPVVLVIAGTSLTKADKLSRTQQARQAAAIKKQLNVPAENVIITSSQTGTGIDELKRRIAEACL